MAYFRNKLKSELNTATNIPAPVDIPPEMLSDEDHLDRELEPQPEPKQVAQSVPPEGDAGTALLRQHIDAMERARVRQEDAARERQIVADRELRRVEWLKATPAAQANYAALGPLHHQAMQAGLADLSPEYFHHLESGLAAIAQSQPQPASEPSMEQPMDEPAMAIEQPAPAAVEPTPEFFRPKRVSMPAPRQIPVSAPVSRTIPSADRDRIATDPRSVRLTPAQREAAKIAGISEAEYARGLIGIEQEKREGRRQP